MTIVHLKESKCSWLLALRNLVALASQPGILKSCWNRKYCPYGCGPDLILCTWLSQGLPEQGIPLDTVMG